MHRIIRTAPPARRLTAALIVATSTLLLSACGAPSGEPPAASPPPSADGAWPRTVDVGDRSSHIAAAPQRIVALTTETSDLALHLASPDRVAAIAAGSTTEGAGNEIELAAQVETVLPAGTTPDPEQILALQPDLVLMTSRHAGEADAADVLEASGVPTLVFGADDLGSPQAVADSVRLLGRALGAEDVAESSAAAVEQRVAELTALVATAGESPRVLGLMARGDELMITGEGSTLETIGELAGATSVAAEQGWRGSVAADPELLLAANPDVILVEDFRGAGLAPFEQLLQSDAVAGVPAIADGRVELVPSQIASGGAGLRLVDGLEHIVHVLHPEQA